MCDEILFLLLNNLANPLLFQLGHIFMMILKFKYYSLVHKNKSLYFDFNVEIN